MVAGGLFSLSVTDDRGDHVFTGLTLTVPNGLVGVGAQRSEMTLAATCSLSSQMNSGDVITCKLESYWFRCMTRTGRDSCGAINIKIDKPWLPRNNRPFLLNCVQVADSVSGIRLSGSGVQLLLPAVLCDTRRKFLSVVWIFA